jgi:signal transduction histidine kinase
MIVEATTVERLGAEIEDLRRRLHEAEEALAALREDRVRAEETAREAARRKDEFLALLAHELRNPLGPVRNAIQILRLQAAGDPVQRQFHDMIDRQVGHMARLIDDLLDISRIARGSIPLRKECCDLADVVRTTAEDYRGILETTGLSFTVCLPDQPVWAEGDRTRLCQIVGNLLHNANKFTDAGGSVEVRLAVEEGAAVLVVRDTGVGMEPALLAQVFEPFCVGDTSPGRKRGGLGLGLALVKGLVELHGGTVRVVSAGPGQGTVVTLCLPLVEASKNGRAGGR